MGKKEEENEVKTTRDTRAARVVTFSIAVSDYFIGQGQVEDVAEVIGWVRQPPMQLDLLQSRLEK